MVKIWFSSGDRVPDGIRKLSLEEARARILDGRHAEFSADDDLTNQYLISMLEDGVLEASLLEPDEQLVFRPREDS